MTLDLNVSAFDAAFSLQPSATMPVLFVGHGSPMNAIEDTPYRRSWQELGQAFGKTWPQPQLILCISAHWLTRGWWLTGMAQPKTIHDFGGFPQALFEQQYPAPGSPGFARALAAAMPGPQIQVDEVQWGLDHGAWSVLKPMFAQADIAVVQLSMDYSRPMGEHFAVGRCLSALRERGVLIVGSGNVVHNLPASFAPGAAGVPAKWAVDFDNWVAAQVQSGELALLAGFQELGATTQQAHPSYEHFLPLLYAAGAARAGEPVRFFNDSFQLAGISMRSVIWG